MAVSALAGAAASAYASRRQRKEEEKLDKRQEEMKREADKADALARLSAGKRMGRSSTILSLGGAGEGARAKNTLLGGSL